MRRGGTADFLTRIGMLENAEARLERNSYNRDELAVEDLYIVSRLQEVSNDDVQRSIIMYRISSVRLIRSEKTMMVWTCRENASRRNPIQCAACLKGKRNKGRSLGRRHN